MEAKFTTVKCVFRLKSYTLKGQENLILEVGKKSLNFRRFVLLDTFDSIYFSLDKLIIVRNDS